MSATTTERIESVIVDAVEAFAPDDVTVTRDSAFAALDIDSLDLVELVQVLDDEFGVKIESADMKELATVGDVVDLVAARTA
jgi:acyl carrier protein